MTVDGSGEIEIRIDSLVVHGFAGADARRATVDFDRRLTELARREGAGLRSAASPERVASLSLDLPPDARSSSRPGEAAADALWRGLRSSGGHGRRARRGGAR
jgi:hypothetical protein